MSLAELRLIHTISRCEFIAKVGKYVVDVEFHNHPKTTFWISEKQHQLLAKKLQRLWSKRSDERGWYSRADKQLWLVVEKGKYWALCGLHTPFESDLPWLCERFGLPLSATAREFVERREEPIRDEPLPDLVDMDV